MHKLRQFPATIILVIVNIAVFIYFRHSIGTFVDPIWTHGLLVGGAEFAPLSLGKEWYRLFTHMFMHGNAAHLLFNLYALLVVGIPLEEVTGTKKFLLIYFISGFTASLASLYFNLFVIGVGASGAIFGLFGFSLVVQIREGRKRHQSTTPIIINFIVFLGINLFFAKALNADNAAHMGGLVGGLLLGLASLLDPSYKIIKVEYVFIPVCIFLFLALPRYQVTYFQFFQKVLSIDNKASELFDKKNVTDDEFLAGFKNQYVQWDTARWMLDKHTYLPEALHRDTSKLRTYVSLKKKEAKYRIDMIEKTTFRYLDSIAIAQELMQQNMRLDYPLNVFQPIPDVKRDSLPQQNLTQVQVWYDKEWVELPGPPGLYYRIGQRDSLGRWQGVVRDFYKDGLVQMKGSYSNNLKNGVFLYYSDHNTYTSAGRYKEDKSIGKWETFHYNGRLKSEEYYVDEYFMKSNWDSLGHQQVKDGEGTYTDFYENEIVAEKGEIHNGKRVGLWHGYHKDGSTYFEEYYENGILVKGRSREQSGQTFLYDASSYFPMPEDGNEVLLTYLKRKIVELDPAEHGRVRVAFRVTVDHVLTDFIVEKSLNVELDGKAIEFVKDGPAWIPARLHGQIPYSGYARVSMDF